MYLPRNGAPRGRPAPAELEGALVRLRERCPEAVRAAPAAATAPLRFSGRKGRRLVVAADAAVRPEWGAWDRLQHGEAQRSFTRLRAAVNALIALLEVDHIDVDVSSAPGTDVRPAR